jgi:tetrapyrrole methylase family protein/MazG family protein
VSPSSLTDIYLVGLGMFGMRQVTAETLEILGHAKRVFHVTDKHEQLCAINPESEDLSGLYWRSGKNVDVYDDVARYVVSFARQKHPTVLALDGNPMFFNDISWKIAALGKLEGLKVEAIPAVSCIDVLPIQLGFEPGNLGMQIFEATQLVLYQLSINPYLSTLVLQVGVFGETSVVRPVKRKPATFLPLVMHLRKFFPSDHPAIFIQSAYSSHVPTVVFTIDVGSIDECGREIGSGMTLYLPRVGIPTIEQRICEQLGVPELNKDLQS